MCVPWEGGGEPPEPFSVEEAPCTEAINEDCTQEAINKEGINEGINKERCKAFGP